MRFAAPAPRAATLEALPAQVRHAVRAALMPDEQVLWAGKPVSGAAWADMMPAVVSTRWARVLLFATGARVTLYVLLVFVVLGGAAMWEWATRDNFGWAQLPVFLFFVVLLLWLITQLVVRLVFPTACGVRTRTHRRLALRSCGGDRPRCEDEEQSRGMMNARTH